MDSTLAGLIDIDRRGPEPLMRQLCAQLRSAIAGNRLRPGDRLPSSRLLAAQLGVSRNTIAAVVDQLASEGYLGVARGRRPEIAAGLATPPRASASRRGPARAPLRLSLWARSVGQADWPFAGEGAARPFAPGLADARAFPHDLWGRCLRRAARRVDPRSGTHNRAPLQAALARHLTEHRGVKTEPRQIIMTPSAQAAIELIARLVLDAGDLAWLENPGYGGARVALDAVGARTVGVPLDRGGMVLAGREDRPRLIFVTPSHQYPTGRLMPVDRRLQLLHLAASVGAVLIEDDYDSEFHYDGRPVACLQGLDQAGCVFYVGTFSKVMMADIRVGYTVVPEHLVEIFERAQRHTGQLVSTTLQNALSEFMDEGAYAAHIRRMTRIYSARRDRMVAALDAETRGALVTERPAGGMQLLARCRHAQDDRILCARLAESGVTARPFSAHFMGKAPHQGLFLGFAAWTEAEIDAGARLIGKIVARNHR